MPSSVSTSTFSRFASAFTSERRRCDRRAVVDVRTRSRGDLADRLDRRTGDQGARAAERPDRHGVVGGRVDEYLVAGVDVRRRVDASLGRAADRRVGLLTGARATDPDRHRDRAVQRALDVAAGLGLHRDVAAGRRDRRIGDVRLDGVLDGVRRMHDRDVDGDQRDTRASRRRCRLSSVEVSFACTSTSPVRASRVLSWMPALVWPFTTFSTTTTTALKRDADRARRRDLDLHVHRHRAALGEQRCGSTWPATVTPPPESSDEPVTIASVVLSTVLVASAIAADMTDLGARRR